MFLRDWDIVQGWNACTACSVHKKCWTDTHILMRWLENPFPKNRAPSWCGHSGSTSVRSCDMVCVYPHTSWSINTEVWLLLLFWIYPWPSLAPSSSVPRWPGYLMKESLVEGAHPLSDWGSLHPRTGMGTSCPSCLASYKENKETVSVRQEVGAVGSDRSQDWGRCGQERMCLSSILQMLNGPNSSVY